MPAGKGRPTKYKNEYAGLADQFCSLGATDADLAKFFRVDEATINRWKHAHPDFCKSLKNGKRYSDDKIVQRLFDKALEGDTTAMIFWLKNRQSKDWRDRKEIAVDTVDSPFGRFVTADKQDGD